MNCASSAIYLASICTNRILTRLQQHTHSVHCANQQMLHLERLLEPIDFLDCARSIDGCLDLVHLSFILVCSVYLPTALYVSLFVCLSASRSVGRSVGENSHSLVNATFLTHPQLQPRPQHTSLPQHSLDDSIVRSAWWQSALLLQAVYSV